MLQYALKRCLLIPPTFFLVSIVIFVVLNIAPGRPGEQAQLNGEKAGAQQRESYRIFKEQFNLDKPVLFNARFALHINEVRALLMTAYGLRQAPTLAAKLRAQNELEDLGSYLVRHLIALRKGKSRSWPMPSPLSLCRPHGAPCCRTAAPMTNLPEQRTEGYPRRIQTS